MNKYVRVLGSDWLIKTAEGEDLARLEDESRWGETRKRSRVIFLHPDAGPDILLHELIHAVEESLLEDDLDESTVQVVARGLYAVLRDNGWIPEYLLLS